jgi:hypothetical protein
MADGFRENPRRSLLEARVSLERRCGGGEGDLGCVWLTGGFACLPCVERRLCQLLSPTKRHSMFGGARGELQQGDQGILQAGSSHAHHRVFSTLLRFVEEAVRDIALPSSLPTAAAPSDSRLTIAELIPAPVQRILAALRVPAGAQNQTHGRHDGGRDGEGS